MHLSLLSDAFLSDSIKDAGASPRGIASAPSHFAALCRGVAVLAALSLPVGLTLFAQTAPAGSAQAGGSVTVSGAHEIR